MSLALVLVSHTQALDRGACVIATARLLMGIRTHGAAQLPSRVALALERSRFAAQVDRDPQWIFERWQDLRPYLETDQAWHAKVKSRAATLGPLSLVGAPKRVASKKAKSLVFKISWKGSDGSLRHGVFRPLDGSDNLTAPRRTLAASKLARALGLDSLPRSDLAVVQGEVGVVSEFVEGATLPLHVDVIDRPEIFNSDSFQNLMLFEFLIKNGDAHNENWKWANGKAASYDYDKAFSFGLLSRFHIYRLGRDLPESYNPRLLAALRALDDVRLADQLGEDLSEKEIQALSLRREIILLDSENRGGGR